MPAKRSQSPIQWYRLRCVGCACLTAGVWAGIWMTTTVPEQPGRGLAAPPAAAQAAALPARRPLREGAAIIIDAGHGGRDPGKPAGEQLEKTWTLRVSLALAEELRARGWPVELTRADDAAVSLGERADFANGAPRRALVSIHFNSGQPEAAGLEVYFAWPKSPETMVRLDAELSAPAQTSVRDDRGRLLAEALQSAACAATGSRSRGVRNDPDLAVLNRTRCPSVLVECGFLTNAAECEAIQSDVWRQQLVTGLADGLETWLEAAREPGYGVSFEPVAGVAEGIPAGAVNAQ